MRTACTHIYVVFFVFLYIYIYYILNIVLTQINEFSGSFLKLREI